MINNLNLAYILLNFVKFLIDERNRLSYICEGRGSYQ